MDSDYERYRHCFSGRRYPNKTKFARIKNFCSIEADVINGDDWLFDFCKTLESKSYRRLDNKTQVYTMSDNPFVRNRLSHTADVISLSIKMANFFGLNVSLCQAVAAGHDIGHVPFGHLGEDFVSKITGKKFRHEIFSVTLAKHIERKGWGLNLCQETMEGILNHSRGNKKLIWDNDLPLEYGIVMLADKIAYIFSDINDFIRLRKVKELPKELEELGHDQRSRVHGCLTAVFLESGDQGGLSFSLSQTAKHFESLKQWMYQNVYYTERDSLFEAALQSTYDKFLQPLSREIDVLPILLLLLMTDKEVIKVAQTILTAGDIDFEYAKSFGFMEIAPYLKNFDLEKIFNP